MLVIGAGPSGLYAAYYAGFRGFSVGVMDSLPEINRVERYATAMVCDKGENIKFRLTFTGAS